MAFLSVTRRLRELNLTPVRLAQLFVLTLQERKAGSERLLAMSQVVLTSQNLSPLLLVVILAARPCHF